MHQHPTTDKAILDWLEDEYAQPFEGWDFSTLADRMVESGQLGWDYASLVLQHLAHSTSLLDHGTGGGEILAGILGAGGFRGKVHATEAYPPNVVAARKRLAPLGVTVHDTSGSRAQFEDGAFDLVIDRHGGDNTPHQIMDWLAPGGHFVTQQVGRGTNQELRTWFGTGATEWPGIPENAAQLARAFADAGFKVQHSQTGATNIRFMDAGALVRYIKAVPWEVPGFSITKHAQKLLELHRQSLAQGYAIDTTFEAYVMIAQKPG